MKLTDIDTARPGGWGLLLRHAERHSIIGKGIGIDVPLTDAGCVAARALGAELAPLAWNAVLASPVLRCRQTAIELCQGNGRSLAEAEAEVITEPLLAGAYVDDPELATQTFGQQRPEEVVLAHADGERLPGFRSVAAGSELLLPAILRHLEPSTLSLFVTHDALVIPFQRHFCARERSLTEWVGFLEGAIIYIDGETVEVDGHLVRPRTDAGPTP